MKTLCKIFSFVKIMLVLDDMRVSIWWPNAPLQILWKFLRPEQVRREDVSAFVLFVCLYYKIRISGCWTKEPLHSTFPSVFAQTLKRTGNTISTQSERRIDLSSEQLKDFAPLDFKWFDSQMFMFMLHAEMERGREGKETLKSSSVSTRWHIR